MSENFKLKIDKPDNVILLKINQKIHVKLQNSTCNENEYFANFIHYF
jgi:hypothetical protein